MSFRAGYRKHWRQGLKGIEWSVVVTCYNQGDCWWPLLLEPLVTEDETWVYQWDPKSMAWKHHNFSPPRKWTMLSAGQVVASFCSSSTFHLKLQRQGRILPNDLGDCLRLLQESAGLIWARKKKRIAHPVTTPQYADPTLHKRLYGNVSFRLRIPVVILRIFIASVTFFSLRHLRKHLRRERSYDERALKKAAEHYFQECEETSFPFGIR